MSRPVDVSKMRSAQARHGTIEQVHVREIEKQLLDVFKATCVRVISYAACLDCS